MNANLQNKLQQFSATPPPGVWNKIADVLDENEAFAQRLYAYEETPPAGVWSNVEQEILHGAAPAAVIPFRKKNTIPLRYAAIASVLAAVLVSATLLLKRTEPDTSAARSSPITFAQEQPPTAILSERQQQTGVPLSPGLVQNAATTSLTPNQSGKRLQQEISFDTPQPMESTNYANKNPNRRHYITYNDAEGNVRKVSKRVARLINCKETDLPCIERVRMLQQKMATNAMTTDFTGILEMLQQLQ